MIQEKIKTEIKEAMKAKDTVRLNVLRGISAAFVNELVSKRLKPEEALSDDDALTVIKRLARQRKDSIEQFRMGGRADLAEKEQVELEVLEKYLPTAVSREEIEKVVREKMTEPTFSDKSKAGQLVGLVMKEFKGSADGNLVKEVVNSLFTNP